MKHVVVGIISRQNAAGSIEYLLMSSKKDFGEFTGFYYPPGGHLEEGEDEVQALKREIQEEFGVDVDPVEKLAETPGDVANQITHWWRCETSSYDFVLQEDEVKDVRWFTLDEIQEAENIWPATQKFFAILKS